MMTSTVYATFDLQHELAAVLMSREWREPLVELSTATAEAMRLCLGLAEDMHESGQVGVCVEEVRQQLLAMVRLDRELSHLLSALEGVEGTVGNMQAAETPLEPPNLVDEMEKVLTALAEEDAAFDPTTHQCVQELARMLAGGEGGGGDRDGDEGEGDEDVLVGEVQVSLKCPLTRRYLDDPVSNPQCGHAYSRAAVLRHIQQRAASVARCPLCSGPLSAGTLRPEPALAEKVRRAQRRRSQRQQQQQNVVNL